MAQYNPIWRDYIVSLLYPRFRIKDASDNVVYEGVTSEVPGYVPGSGTQYKIRINDICADYMQRHALPVLAPLADIAPGMQVEYFSIESTEDDWETVEPDDYVYFIADWSYDPALEVDPSGDAPLSFPISRKLDGRQKLFFSFCTDADSILVKITQRDGTVNSLSLTVHRTADFNADYNGDHATTEGDVEYPYGIAVLDLSVWPNAARVDVPLLGLSWEVIGMCRRYALVYLNAAGGWDSFLPADFETMTDKYTRHAYRDSDRRHALSTEIIRGFTFRTGRLTDAGAANMHHLLGSTAVYLHDLLADTFAPVLVADASCKHKTFRNEGGKPVEYTFNVELAANMVRK